LKKKNIIGFQIQFKTSKAILFIVFLISFSFQISAQRDAAHWYFGNFAGLNFNSGIPELDVNGALDTVEGCSAISDKETGELLFYTEGTTVWNRNHQIMLNGTELLGSLSSTQSAVIVPQPGSDSIFYIFTTDVVQAYQINGMGNGINYSIVSMNGDNGLGEVIEKNTNLLVEGSEKISVVETSDGVNFWIVTHFENNFYSYFFDDSGVNTTPIVSTIGPDINDFENFRGAMKISPDGNRLAISHCLFEPSLGGTAHLYDFNNETGVVSNELLIGNQLVYYGVEFSSDSSKLYFSGKTINNQGQSDRVIIEQYDLNAASITNSRFVVLDYENDLVSDLAGALQIAMDKKIYHSLPLPSNSLSVINNPKLVGNNIDFGEESLNLGLRSGSFGLPQYIQSFFESFITVDNICENDQTAFSVDPNANVTGALWNFGDITSGANNTSTIINPTHEFSSPGFYTVTVEFEFTNRAPKTFVEFVNIVPQLNLPTAITFTQCDVDGIDDGISFFDLDNYTDDELGISNTQYRYYHSIGNAQTGQNPISDANNYENSSNGEVIYLVVGDEVACNTIVEITLDVSINPDGTNFSHEICDIVLSSIDVWMSLEDLKAEILQNFQNESLEYYFTLEDAISQSNPLTIDTTPPSLSQSNFFGVFYRVSNDFDCLAIGYIEFDILPSFEEENKVLDFCPSEGALLLTPDELYSTYEWSTGETTPGITITEPGAYTVDLVTLGGCDSRLLFTVNEVEIVNVEIEVNDFQQYNSIVVNSASDSSLLYSINGGLSFQESPVFDNLPPGIYNLVISGLDDTSCNNTNRFIEVRGAPRYFTPNGDGTHDFWHVNNPENYEGMIITIFDRYGKQLFQMNNRSRGWNGTYAGRLMPTNAYWYRIEYEGDGHFTLVRR